MPDQSSIKCVIMRGGTSKGVMFDDAYLPPPGPARDRLLLSVMGTPDPRQIDGLGGADPLTSKVCIIGRPSVPDADIDYTYALIGIEEPVVSWSTNCGNLSAAVGVYAIEEGLVAARAPETIVRIYNTNTKQMFQAIVPVVDGKPQVLGSYSIPGVPGTGAEIRLDFSRTTGSATGKLLPTGNRKDRLHVRKLDLHLEVSILDVAKPTVYFRATDIGLTGVERPADFTPEILDRLNEIREAAALFIGLDKDSRVPTPVTVAPPATYTNFMTGEPVLAETMSFSARRVLGVPPKPHKAFAATGAVCTAVAAIMKGTVVNDVYVDRGDGVVNIGHPTGLFPVKARLSADGTVEEASYSRTARRIMDGRVYVPAHLINTIGEG
jgi:2-methylaconitate cis-trans-isomerase PrpF